MRYVCSLNVAKQEASDHGDVLQGVRTETQAGEVGGGAGKHGGDLKGLQKTYGDGDRI